MVAFFDIKAQHQALEPELLAAFARVLRSGQFILGPEVASFETALAAAAGTRYAIGVSSGTDAILLALMALGIGPGDEVLCPTFTFFATAGCVSRLGATPVFVDCCPTCFNLDVRDAAAKVTARTKAIIPVHLFGQSAEMDEVTGLARTHELAVIEDGAQAFGAEYKGRKAGAIGAFGTISFFPTKNLGGFGDAGALVTNDDTLAERARVLRTHGARQKYFHDAVGGNFRLDALHAALLQVKLPCCSTYTQRRRHNAAVYSEKLRALAGVQFANLKESACQEGPRVRSTARGGSGTDSDADSAAIILPIAYSHNSHIWNQYTIRVRGGGQRDALRSWLRERNIGAEVYYPLPLHLQHCFTREGKANVQLPVAEQLAAECLSLPIYPELPAEQLDLVVQAIAQFLEERGAGLAPTAS